MNQIPRDPGGPRPLSPPLSSKGIDDKTESNQSPEEDSSSTAPSTPKPASQKEIKEHRDAVMQQLTATGAQRRTLAEKDLAPEGKPKAPAADKATSSPKPQAKSAAHTPSAPSLALIAAGSMTGQASNGDTEDLNEIVQELLEVLQSAGEAGEREKAVKGLALLNFGLKVEVSVELGVELYDAKAELAEAKSELDNLTKETPNGDSYLNQLRTAKKSAAYAKKLRANIQKASKSGGSREEISALKKQLQFATKAHQDSTQKMMKMEGGKNKAQYQQLKFQHGKIAKAHSNKENAQKKFNESLRTSIEKGLKEVFSKVPIVGAGIAVFEFIHSLGSSGDLLKGLSDMMQIDQDLSRTSQMIEDNPELSRDSKDALKLVVDFKREKINSMIKETPERLTLQTVGIASGGVIALGLTAGLVGLAAAPALLAAAAGMTGTLYTIHTLKHLATYPEAIKQSSIDLNIAKQMAKLGTEFEKTVSEQQKILSEQSAVFKKVTRLQMAGPQLEQLKQKEEDLKAESKALGRYQWGKGETDTPQGRRLSILPLLIKDVQAHRENIEAQLKDLKGIQAQVKSLEDSTPKLRDLSKRASLLASNMRVLSSTFHQRQVAQAGEKKTLSVDKRMSFIKALDEAIIKNNPDVNAMLALFTGVPEADLSGIAILKNL